jgi:hypothetical protein
VLKKAHQRCTDARKIARAERSILGATGIPPDACGAGKWHGRLTYERIRQKNWGYHDIL